MCLISILPKGTEKINEKTIAFIKSGMSCNRDGSGFMYKKNGDNKIYVKKGYFNIEYMLDALKELDLKEDDELVIHHRIGTGGDVSNENTHPYLIDNSEDTKFVEGVFEKPCIVHNGFIYNIADLEKLNPRFSDTYAFARYFLTKPYVLNILNDHTEDFEFMFSKFLGSSKLCILRPEGEMIKTGNYIEDNGYFHSNSGYCTYVHNRGGVETNFPVRVSKKNSVITTNYSQQFSEGFGSINNLFPQTPAPQKKLYQTNKMDNSVVKLTKDNFHHFLFVNKEQYNNNIEKKEADRSMLRSYILQNFDDSLYFNITESKNTINSKTWIGVSREKLIEDYYYIPRDLKTINIYSALLEIVNTYPNYNKSSYKKLFNLLKKRSVANKDDNHSIRYDRMNKSYSKIVLQYYYDYLTNQRDSVSKQAKIILLN
jgi:predicted glutamine amidotransferase